MNHLFKVLLILVLCTVKSVLAGDRKTQLLNFDWKFTRSDLGLAFNEWFDDSKWETVQLPHDASVNGIFSSKESTGSNGWLPNGKGWYRKYFDVPLNTKEGKVFIRFDGIYRSSEVWCNGVYMGKHLNGYLGFEYDLTRENRFGNKNVIVVKFDNSIKGTSRWYTGEGIYRDVWLILTDKMHIPQYGTYVATPEIKEDMALLKVETNVLNEYDERKICRLVRILQQKSTKGSGKCKGFFN